MAQIKLIFACVFLLIFSQEIQPIEGRHLKLGKKNELPKLLQTHSKFLVKETNIAEDISKLNDDSTNKTVHANEPPPPTAPGQVVDESTPPPPLGRGVDDFRPTAPGHSPGVGHSLEN
ncbi:hypothetical protein L1049_023836 [Liquidambar formosana]|uniref:Uncharacterized protein n=1 Tax=Liquidambar formosana TaxID=63359 RepID=A0AAP0S0X3_LIQFO